MPSTYYSWLITILMTLLCSTTSFAAAEIEPQFIEQDEYFNYADREDTVVIDVRTPREFKAGYIPGAINIPHRDILRGKRSLEQYKDKNIVFYCHTGVRVGFVVNYLEKNPSLEPDKIYHLRGDYRAWNARGLEIAKP